MEEFFRTYGVWILLGIGFFALHRFGMGCGGGHCHGPRHDEKPTTPDEKKGSVGPNL